jgi:hypothetical protein
MCVLQLANISATLQLLDAQLANISNALGVMDDTFQGRAFLYVTIENLQACPDYLYEYCSPALPLG